VKKEDGGIYTCVAENFMFKPAEHRVYVLVESAPIVTAPMVRFGQALRNLVDFECKVQAYPPPIIVWMKDGTKLPNNT